jgi:subfamily B ATP-binding cassette protein MsbA
MTEDDTLRERGRALAAVATFRPGLAATVVGASLLVAALEGVGMGFVLPIVEFARNGAGQPSGLARYFLRAYAVLGLPFTLGTVLLGVGLVVGVRYALSFLVSWLGAALEVQYVEHLRYEAFASALEARVAYCDREGSDELLNAIVTQTQYAGDAIAVVVRLVERTTIALVYLLLALALAPVLTLLTVAVVGGSTYLVRSVVESGYDVGERVAAANQAVQRSVQAGMQGIRDVKLFDLRGEFLAGFGDAAERYTAAMVAQHRNQAAINSANRFLTAAAVFGLVYAGLEVASLSLGALGVFLFVMLRLGPTVSSLNDLVYSLENTLPHLVRTQAFVARLEAHREPTGDRSPSPPVDRLAVKGVDFAYDRAEGPVLEDVSVALERGEFVALVGPSGAGKSTVASLVARLYEPDAGTITADGTPIDRFDVAAWRSRVAVVRQDPFVFNETLRFNLTVGNRDATRAELDRACRIARVDEFRDDLADGYGTVLGDDGVRLSGGQKQRVAIARALLTDADFLVLDEATSELDGHLDAAVHRGIAAMDRDYGIVAIAHRLSTITDADRIVVLEDGRVVERGQHDELVDRDGTYAALYERQVDG